MKMESVRVIGVVCVFFAMQSVPFAFMIGPIAIFNIYGGGAVATAAVFLAGFMCPPVSLDILEVAVNLAGGFQMGGGAGQPAKRSGFLTVL